MCDRYIDIERFASNAGAFFRAHDAKRTHIVDAVSELHENHSNVSGHGQQHLAEAFGLSNFV